MRPELSASFDELREARRQLANQCTSHETTLKYFRAPERSWYRVLLNERWSDSPGAKARIPLLRHLSTSASCLQSLWDLPSAQRKDAKLGPTVAEFSRAALAAKKWESDGAAHTYCRVRALPLILEHASAEILKPSAKTIRGHLEFAWGKVAAQRGEQGIAEHAAVETGASSSGDERTYPPNAFLTYWGLRCLRAARSREVLTGEEASGFMERESIALLWSRATLGSQVALSYARSDRFDPQQLAWAIATLVEFNDAVELRQPAVRSLIEAGLDRFFGAQQDAGGWQRGEPLFHYPKIGSAYCYTFETLGELIRPALRREATAYRDLLRPYADRMLQAWRLTEATRLAIGSAGVGWCSGHYPQQTEAEAWATATVFSYLQLLWRLVGYWARETAARTLGATTSRWPVEGQALVVLRERGDTWPVKDGWTTGNYLGGLFLNPIRHGDQIDEWLEPDAHLMGEYQPRGAILFGPPGTGKTTLVEALAGALGWEYVEIHASHFLADGMANVPARADAIFKSVMELDRCVVLFDEIDELLRAREKDSDPFGRFLTTSMLPKLTKLWDQRRVLYFVNTNWIEATDAAIRRSQRFDAAILVPPPSLSRKVDGLSGFLTKGAIAALTQDRVDEALRLNQPLGWLALVRWDQMEGLRSRLAHSTGRADLKQLEHALQEIGRQLVTSDWRPSGDGTLFSRYREMLEEVRIDGRALPAMWLDRRAAGIETAKPPAGYRARTEWRNAKVLVQLPAGIKNPQDLRLGKRAIRGDTILHFPAG